MYLHLTAAFLASLFHFITGLRFRFSASPTDAKQTAQALTTIDSRPLSANSCHSQRSPFGLKRQEGKLGLAGPLT